MRDRQPASEPVTESVTESATEPATEPATEEKPPSPGDGGHLPGGSVQTGQPEEFSTPERFDWRGWFLVVVVFVSFLVVPGFIVFLPEAHTLIAGLGFSWRQAYLVFPMIPAILLGITAVWAVVRSQSS